MMMGKLVKEQDVLWDHVIELIRKKSSKQASALFKNLITQTISVTKMPGEFLYDETFDLSSDEKIDPIRKSGKKLIETSLNIGDPSEVYNSFVEFLENLSKVIVTNDRQEILAKAFVEQMKKGTGQFSEPTSKAFVEPIDYSTLEAAEIVGVSDQTIRRWCEKGKFPEAKRTESGHWRIPKKYFKISLEDARKRRKFEQRLNEYNAKHGEDYEDE
ncbi:putative site-specific integrase-resolvase [Caldibacillus debilis GB1]|uniref:Putative site-specific integrase-resolvase n=2 Tax=Caldibacillus debilis TaxID=301148 RepID=A0A420VEF0_9BACI|nr:putative site-specific integrase-resolvase [Caldibacillus debilis GB1]